jgi:hypothetical protein
VLLLATIVLVLSTGCESLRCHTCPDAQIEPSTPIEKA